MSIATSPDVVRENPRAAGPIRGLSARVAGLGAIGFAALVVIQNAMRGSSAPANDASAEAVLAHFADHRTLTVALVASFVLSASALAAFLGGSMRRLAAAQPGWAITGGLGAAGVMALFSVVVGCEQALAVLAAGEEPDLGAIQALWALHNSVFTVSYLLLAIALVGLSRAGVAAGLTPRAFAVVAPIGAGLLAIGAVAGPYIANGEAMPAFGGAGIGFLTWLAFLVATGMRLVRDERGTA